MAFRNLMLAASLAAAMPALAGAMDGVIGNTLKLTTRGHTIAYMFRADHSLTALVGGRTRMEGKWRLAGDTLCLRLGMQGIMGPETCIPAIPSDKGPGDQWDMTVNGTTTHAQIVAGAVG